MIRIRKPALYLSATLLVLSPLLAERGSDAGAEENATPASAAAEPLSAYTIGDRLKISFFEELDLPGGEGGASVATRTLYHRVDLTAEYSVAADGTVTLPRLGQLVVAGRGAQEVHEELLSRYEKQIGRVGDVHVAIVERQPVYVVGPVRQPGAFRFTEGMVAIQAIALAGGTENGREHFDPLMRAGQETERSDQAAIKLAGLLARRAYLEAAQEGRDPITPRELIDLIGRPEANRLIAAETRAGAAGASARQAEIRGYDGSIEAARREAAAIEGAVERISHEINARVATIDQVSEPDPRLTKHEVVGRMQSEITLLEAQRQQLQGNSQRLQQAIARDSAARDRVHLDHRAVAARDLVSVVQEIVATKQAIASAQDLAGSIYGVLGETEEGYSVEIVRTTRTGPETLVAEETTPLKPGDVVRLRPSRSTGALRGGISQ